MRILRVFMDGDEWLVKVLGGEDIFVSLEDDTYTGNVKLESDGVMEAAIYTNDEQVHYGIVSNTVRG
jgi:hypothetical protein